MPRKRLDETELLRCSHAELRREAERSRASEARLIEALKGAERALEHSINRPHEHNPVGPFAPVSCEILVEALDAARAALKGAES